MFKLFKTSIVIAVIGVLVFGSILIAAPRGLWIWVPVFFLAAMVVGVVSAGMFVLSGIGMLFDKERRALGLAVVIVSLAVAGWVYYQATAEDRAEERRRELVASIEHDDLELFQKLLRKCNEKCRYEKDLNDYLGYAVAYESHVIAAHLLADRAKSGVYPSNVNFLKLKRECAGGDFMPVIRLAVAHERPDTLALLLKYADQSEKNEALWYSVEAGKVDYADRAFRSGAQMNITYPGSTMELGASLITAAIESYSTQTLDWVLDKKLPINGAPLQPTHLPHVAVPLVVWTHSARVESMHTGGIDRSLPLLQRLLESGADLNYPFNDNAGVGESLAEAIHLDVPLAAQALVRAGADLSRIDPNSKTRLDALLRKAETIQPAEHKKDISIPGEFDYRCVGDALKHGELRVDI